MNQFANLNFDVILWILLIAVSLLVGLYVLVSYLIKLSVRNKVDETSQRLFELRVVNRMYEFIDLQQQYSYTHYCYNKNSFDSCDVEEMMVNYIQQDVPYFENLIKQIDANAEQYRRYEDSLEQIYGWATENDLSRNHVVFKKLYLKIEEEMYNAEKLNPVIAPYFSMTKLYTSPKGRNRYSYTRDFTYKHFLYLYSLVFQRAHNRNSAFYQRQLMTPSLRTAVLKRDRYRCVLCGRSTKEDGVKLEVDHIIPVSKGGKTEMSNLQTLCWDCNRGKGADTGYEYF